MTIDWWTLGLQAVNVLILVWLLGWLFWRPVSAMIAQRSAAARSILAEAEAKRAAAAAALAEIDKTRKGFADERAAILQAAREEADRLRAAAQASAATAAKAEEEAMRKRIAAAETAGAQAWAERAARLAVEIAARLAARLGGDAVQAAFLDGLLRAIGALPPAERQAATLAGDAITIVSATPLDAAAQARHAERITAALGGGSLAFAIDPSLIAGLELRGTGLVIRNSWRADLDQALEALTHDFRP